MQVEAVVVGIIGGSFVGALLRRVARVERAIEVAVNGWELVRVVVSGVVDVLGEAGAAVVLAIGVGAGAGNDGWACGCIAWGCAH